MKENKMGVLGINHLLVTMSIPMILSMLVQALYNIVDSIFVAQVSEHALTAVSLAFPFQSLMIAVGVGTGVGVNSLLSRLLGEHKTEMASKAAENGIFLAFVSYIVFALLGITLAEIFFLAQTDVQEIIENGISYLEICTLFSIGLFMQTMLEKLLSSTGRTGLTMLTQMSGALINIILDPILIFGLLGFPAMGTAGAAAATVIGQNFAMVVGFILNWTMNKEISFSFRGFRPDGLIISRIYAVGFPSIIMSSIGSVMTFCMNFILIGFSTTAAAVFGVYFKLQSFVFMPIFGLSNGLIPIVAYNFGAGSSSRVIKAIKYAVFYATGIMLIGLCLFQFFPRNLLSLFNPSEAMVQIGIPALRIISIHFLIAGYCIMCSSAFQALGHGLDSLIISVIRQLVVLLPVAWLLSKTGNLDMVWLSFPVAEIFSATFSTIFLVHIYRKEIKHLKPIEA